MTEQPTALRLAAELEATHYYEDLHEEVAAELRRLYLVEQALERCRNVCDAAAVEIRRLVAQRAALLEALRGMIDHAEFWINHHQKRHMSEQDFKVWLALGHESNAMLNARAAIKKVEEGK